MQQSICTFRPSVFGRVFRVYSVAACVILIPSTAAHAQTPILSQQELSVQESEGARIAHKGPVASVEQRTAQLRDRSRRYADTSNFKQAIQVLREEMALRKRFDPNELPESWIILGNLYRLQGHYSKAYRWMNRGITALESSHPCDPARMSAAFNYLALLQNSAGVFSDSEASARKALAMSKEASLPDDVGAMHMVVLANALRQQGNYQEAMRNLETAMPILTKPPKNEALLATATNNLGALYFWLGDYQKALTLLEEGLRLRLATFEADHPDIANSYLDLGCTEFRLGQTDLAIDHLSKALDIRQHKLGKTHPETLSAMANLAVTLESVGNSKKALPLLAYTVQAAKHSLGTKHPDLAQYQDDYANVLVHEGLLKQARRHQANSLTIRKNAYGTTSSEYAAGLRSAARIEVAAGKNDEALLLLQRSADIYKSAGERSDPDYADTLEELGTAHFEQNDLEAARAAYVLVTEKRSAGGRTIAYAVSLANLAEVLNRMNRSTEGKDALQRAVDVVKNLPESQRSVPDCLFILERYKQIPTKFDQPKEAASGGR